MKKIYNYLIYICIIIPVSIWIYFFSGLNDLSVDLFILNAIIFILRKPVLKLINFFVHRRFYRAITAIIINITWSVFIFWFIATLPNGVPFVVAILSFLVVSISLNLSKIINNITAGALLLMSGQIEVGDLVETNGIQGIVQEINLNYMRLLEFDGVEVVIPNTNVYGSSIMKFTHKKYKAYNRPKKKEFDKKQKYREYIKMINKLLASGVKTTRYVKSVELLSLIDPDDLKGAFSSVFDRYERVFGIRPEYSVDRTRYGRVRISFYINSQKPDVIIRYTDSFLRDILYELYPEQIYDGWEIYKSKRSEKK